MSDLIYRHEAIEALDTIGYDFSESGLSESELEEVCEAVGNVRQDMISRIKNLPSASTDLSTFSDNLWKIAYERGKAEGRKKGKWVDKSDDIDGAWNYCSVCMEQAIDLYDFCPNCGADMREGE